MSRRVQWNVLSDQESELFSRKCRRLNSSSSQHHCDGSLSPPISTIKRKLCFHPSIDQKRRSMQSQMIIDCAEYFPIPKQTDEYDDLFEKKYDQKQKIIQEQSRNYLSRSMQSKKSQYSEDTATPFALKDVTINHEFFSDYSVYTRSKIRHYFENVLKMNTIIKKGRCVSTLWRLEQQFIDCKLNCDAHKHIDGQKNFSENFLLLFENGYKYETFDLDAMVCSQVLSMRWTDKIGNLKRVLIPSEIIDRSVITLCEHGLNVALFKQSHSGISQCYYSQNNDHHQSHESQSTDKEVTIHSISRNLSAMYSKGTVHATLDSDGRKNQRKSSSLWILCLFEEPLDYALITAHRVRIAMIATDVSNGRIYAAHFEDGFLRNQLRDSLDYLNCLGCITEVIRSDLMSESTLAMLSSHSDKPPDLCSTQVTLTWTVPFLQFDDEYELRHTIIDNDCSEYVCISKDILFRWPPLLRSVFGILKQHLSQFDIDLSLLLSTFSITENISDICLLVSDDQKYLNDTDSLLRRSQITKRRYSSFMHMNPATMRQLNLFDTPVNGQCHSLYSFLIQFVETESGKQTMRKWLESPLTIAERIIERQNVVKSAMILLMNDDESKKSESTTDEESVRWLRRLRDVWQSSEISDISKALRWILFLKCPPLYLIKVLKLFSQCLSIFEECFQDLPVIFTRLLNGVDLLYLRERIEMTLKMVSYLFNNNDVNHVNVDGLLKCATLSSEDSSCLSSIQGILREMDECEKQMSDVLNQVINKYSRLNQNESDEIQLKYKHVRNEEYLIEMDQRILAQWSQSPSSLAILEEWDKDCLFINETTKVKRYRIRRLHDYIIKMKYYKACLNKAKNHYYFTIILNDFRKNQKGMMINHLQCIIDALSTADCLFAFAKLHHHYHSHSHSHQSKSSFSKWTFPEIITDQDKIIVHFQSPKYPLLFDINDINDDDQRRRRMIINKMESNTMNNEDCCLKSNGTRAMIVNGCNLSGKTMFLKSVCINVILAQIGCVIAANEGSMIRPLSMLGTRIGICKDDLHISTHMAEMMECFNLMFNQNQSRTMIDDGPSLLCFDNIGQSTSTIDGFAIANSILEELIQHHPQCLVIFVSHLLQHSDDPRDVYSTLMFRSPQIRLVEFDTHSLTKSSDDGESLLEVDTTKQHSFSSSLCIEEIISLLD